MHLKELHWAALAVHQSFQCISYHLVVYCNRSTYKAAAFLHTSVYIRLAGNSSWMNIRGVIGWKTTQGSLLHAFFIGKLCDTERVVGLCEREKYFKMWKFLGRSFPSPLPGLGTEDWGSFRRSGSAPPGTLQHLILHGAIANVVQSNVMQCNVM